MFPMRTRSCATRGGRVQAQAEAAPELLICDIDLSETDAVRAQIPVLRARRTDLYQLKYEKDS